VAVLRGLEVDGLGEIKLLDDHTGTHVEVVADDLDELVAGLLGGTVGVHLQVVRDDTLDVKLERRTKRDRGSATPMA
jgi:hypothetical protein